MRFILRLLGTWLLGAALILIIIDGTKSLGANGLVMTSLGETWASILPDSFVDVETLFIDRGFEGVWTLLNSTLLGWPGFLVVGIPGIMLAVAGRTRSTQIRNIGQV